jgi:NTP pyrophosphatase (non-canonical NTP hydrolase)|tara:strand:+ start:169 stop:489 length:321 start_codon:yes stop_codon:yes gene_type:complete
MDDIVEKLRIFRNERDWAQFHNAKDLSIALNIEASELLELFLWKKPDEADREKVAEELADVFCYALMLADKYDFDIEKIINDKIYKNSKKYPVEKSKGNSLKYTDL